MDARRGSYWDNLKLIPPSVPKETEEEKEKREAKLKAYQEKVERITAIFVDNKDNLTVAISLFCKENDLSFEDIHRFAIDNTRNPEIIIKEVVNRIDLKIGTSKETESLENKEKRLMEYYRSLYGLSNDLSLILRFIGIFSDYILADVYDSFKTEVQPTTLGKLLNLEGSSNGQSNFLKYLEIAIEKLARESEKHFNNYPDLLDDDKNSVRKNLFDFNRVKQYLKTLNNDLDKSNYLVEIRDTFIEQLDLLELRRRGTIRSQGKMSFHHSKGFLKEIIRLLDSLKEQIAARERHTLTNLVSQSNVSKPFAQSNNINSDEDSFDNDNQAKKIQSKYVIPRNEKQVFLALECLFRLQKTTGNHTQNGKLMSFLSGFSSETMRQGYSTFKDYEEKGKDIQYVIKLASENSFDSLENKLKSENKQN